jgi:hypothetical protein
MKTTGNGIEIKDDRLEPTAAPFMDHDDEGSWMSHQFIDRETGTEYFRYVFADVNGNPAEIVTRNIPRQSEAETIYDQDAVLTCGHPDSTITDVGEFQRCPTCHTWQRVQVITRDGLTKLTEQFAQIPRARDERRHVCDTCGRVRPFCLC